MSYLVFPQQVSSKSCNENHASQSSRHSNLVHGTRFYGYIPSQYPYNSNRHDIWMPVMLALSLSLRSHKINLIIADIDITISHRQPHAGCIRLGSPHNFFLQSLNRRSNVAYLKKNPVNARELHNLFYFGKQSIFLS